MKTKELQNSIIQKVWHNDDKQFLEYLNKLLIEKEVNKKYRLSDFEKSLFSDNKGDHLKVKMVSNEEWPNV